MADLGLREPVSALSHGLGALLALAGTAYLWRRGRDAPGRRACLVVYGLCLTACLATSALYHGVRVPPGRLDAYDRLDRVGIFALIAGTYTPLAWALLRGRWRWGLLAAVWGLAVAASARLALVGTLPMPLTTGIYLGMGWCFVACYREIARSASLRDLRFLIVGGVLYSAGAVLNLMEWPTPWPGVVEPHEVFHAFVLAGGLAHYRVMLTVVVPLPRGDARPAPG